MNPLLRCCVALATSAFALAAITKCPPRNDSDFDFIVVGGGAGGGPLAARLAESGYSVLLVDAGHEVVNVNTTIPGYSLRSLEDPQVDLNYTIQEYPVGFNAVRLDSWYPRAQAIGGSTVHNTMVNMVAGLKIDFDGLASTFNDSSWSRDNMQKYFQLIEHDLDPGASPNDHGFNGWLKTRGLPSDVFTNRPQFLDLQTSDLSTGLSQLGPPINDTNALASDGAIGAFAPSATIDENHLRSSVHERLMAVAQSYPKNLQFATDTLATKVLLCKGAKGATMAYGVQIAPGAALPVSYSFGGKVSLNVKNVTARHEVIVSAGTFQSPQLLMLSGIGDEAHLREAGVKPMVNLPGVGQNLQDHDEVAVNWRLKNNFTLFNGCTFLSDPAEDPCLADWNANNHENLYAFNGPLAANITKSSPEAPVPDMLTYILPANFVGFFRGAPQLFAETGNALTAIVLFARGSTRGTVRLTGSHPQDLLDIQKLRFQDPVGGPKDIAILREGVQRARDIANQTLIAPHVAAEVLPGPNVTTDAEVEEYIKERIFGHHACCTNAMGPDNDTNAVLDGNFQVRGVKGLRVVDASSWPRIPGFFVATPTYLISEKAADVIIAATKGRK